MSLVTSVLKSSQELMPALNKAYCIVLTEKLTLFFFLDFLGVICRLSINIRIDVNLGILNWEMKGHGSRVNF